MLEARTDKPSPQKVEQNYKEMKNKREKKIIRIVLEEHV
jgi:hypothetical protein